jgi:hypothetical protein
MDHYLAKPTTSPPYREENGGEVATAVHPQIPGLRQNCLARFGEVGEEGRRTGRLTACNSTGTRWLVRCSRLDPLTEEASTGNLENVLRPDITAEEPRPRWSIYP